MLEIISLIITVIFNGLLGLIVFLNNRKNILNRAFLVLALSFSAYGIINYYSLHPRLFDQLTWIRLDIANGVVILTLLFLTFSLFPKGQYHESRAFRLFLIISGLVMLVLCMTPIVFSSLNFSSGHAQPVPNFGIYLYAAFQLLAVIATVYTLFKGYKQVSGIEREQFRYVITGIVLSLLFILIFNFILVQVFQITKLVALGATSSLIFTASFTYAIITKRLFDIRLVVARSVTYLLLLVTLGAVYALIAFRIGGLIFKDTNESTSHLTFNVVLALVMAFSFQPLRRFFEKITDEVFYRDRYDPQTLVNDIGHVLASEINIHRLGAVVVQMLTSQMRLAKADLVVLEGNEIFFEAHTTQPNRLSIELSDLLKMGEEITLVEELPSGQQKDIFDKYQIDASVPLTTSNEFIGYLLLGEKRSGLENRPSGPAGRDYKSR